MTGLQEIGLEEKESESDFERHVSSQFGVRHNACQNEGFVRKHYVGCYCHSLSYDVGFALM